MTLDLSGPFIVMALGCFGSALGYGLMIMRLHSVFSRTKKKFAQFFFIFIGLHVPVVQLGFPFIILTSLKDAIMDGRLDPESGIKIGFFIGLTVLGFAIVQGICVRSMIRLAEKNISLLPKGLATLGLLELLTFILVLITAMFWPTL